MLNFLVLDIGNSWLASVFLMNRGDRRELKYTFCRDDDKNIMSSGKRRKINPAVRIDY